MKNFMEQTKVSGICPILFVVAFSLFGCKNSNNFHPHAAHSDSDHRSIVGYKSGDRPGFHSEEFHITNLEHASTASLDEPYEDAHFPDYLDVKFPEIHHPVKHTIMIYMNATKDLEKAAWQDIRKVRNSAKGKDTVVYILLAAENRGFYSIRIYGGDSRVKCLNKIKRIDMSDPSTLKTFIEHSVSSVKSEKYSLIFSGHSESFRLSTLTRDFKQKSISVTSIKQVIAQLGIKLFFLAFDSCMTNILETIYELKDSAKYLIGNESYSVSGSDLLSSRFLEPFEKHGSDEGFFDEFADNAAQETENSSTATDLSVIRLDKVELLTHLVKLIELKPEEFEDKNLIDPNDKDFQYDLYETVMNLNRLSKEEKKLFDHVFHQVVMLNKPNPEQIKIGKTHGIGMLKSVAYYEWSKKFTNWYHELDFNQLKSHEVHTLESIVAKAHFFSWEGCVTDLCKNISHFVFDTVAPDFD